MTNNKNFFFISPDLLRFASTAPVVATIWFVITAGILIEFNRFYPDLLTFNQLIK
uniref:photosystem I reaction center subunit IX n=1 Tax=Cephaleuros virescens TaxID=173371 RepID=UPI001EE0B5E3|nr:photosystem I reaction center subunit IX [Cephaleuros virescens]UIB38653.1 photosystem I reaction center subunit IX [Cephaleuros virescens]